MSKIRVGVDFDGVLAYNPFRIVRAPVTAFKRRFLGEKKTHFHIPQNSLEKLIWQVIHETSVFPAKGGGLLKTLAKEKDVEFYLITARYSFLQPQLHNWLKRWGFSKTFTAIYANEKNEQPHLFKKRMLEKLNLHYYIEDNWDVVSFLQDKFKTQIFWIYNISDRAVEYRHKFPYLEKALEKIKFSKVNS